MNNKLILIAVCLFVTLSSCSGQKHTVNSCCEVDYAPGIEWDTCPHSLIAIFHDSVGKWVSENDTIECILLVADTLLPSRYDHYFQYTTWLNGWVVLRHPAQETTHFFISSSIISATDYLYEDKSPIKGLFVLLCIQRSSGNIIPRFP